MELRARRLLMALLLAGLPLCAAAGEQLERMDLAAENGEVILQLHFSEVPDLTVFQLDNPHRLVIDLPDTRQTELRYRLRKTIPRQAVRWLRDVRLGQHEQYLRLVLDSANPVDYSISRGKKHLRIRLRDTGRQIASSLELVLEKKQAPEPAPPAESVQAQKAERAALPTEAAPPKGPTQAQKAERAASLAEPAAPVRNVVVVIDPGHGGKDPGAVNRHGQKEKDIVLQIARKIHRLISPLEGFTAHLTRSGDHYLPLKARLKKAQELQADIFLSIHADSVDRNKPSGASVYVLSLKGASSEAAQRLADRENAELPAESQIGGITLIGDDDFDSTIVDLAQTPTLDRSISMAKAMLGSMTEATKLHADEPGRANFVVLRMPYTPSILIETGFMSNDKDAARLSNERFQRRLARSILSGLYSYLRTNPHTDKAIHNGQKIRYQVQAGDTLSGIALLYGLSSRHLISANELDSEFLHPGQMLALPVPNS